MTEIQEGSKVHAECEAPLLARLAAVEAERDLIAAARDDWHRFADSCAGLKEKYLAEKGMSDTLSAACVRLDEANKAAEARAEALEDALRRIGYSQIGEPRMGRHASVARAALSSEDATRPTQGRTE